MKKEKYEGGANSVMVQRRLNSPSLITIRVMCTTTATARARDYGLGVVPSELGLHNLRVSQQVTERRVGGGGVATPPDDEV